ncbi:hypothetical protein AOQ84DRAFT_296658 [Glonium stellatum]|uniref:gamma-glutamylcyclotransferase n=1 Tax=Glonium stellatum TaxID=574774 RepID=A0A8E2JRD1_9PEZI|nr:hypothetical protein AOQ84DRAFT_296658 [Glonium stellatum]
MAVFLTLPEPEHSIWYLAYGSNLSSTKFVHDRGIVPLATALVAVSGYALSMNSAGVPYQEPSFANISRIHLNENKKCELVGVAYLLNPQMYAKVVASEGGGIAYREEELEAEGVTDEDKRKLGSINGKVAMRALVTVLLREATPSERYMGIITTGAKEANMPVSYQKFLASFHTYQPPAQGFRRVGATLFLFIWVPIMTLMEKLTKMTVKHSKRGNAPLWVVIVVRAVVISMWWWHDHVHAPFWGRGDGLEDCSVQGGAIGVDKKMNV